MIQEPSAITDDFLAQLKQDLTCRRVGRGMARLQDNQRLFLNFDPTQKNAARFAGYLAQWVDIGYQRPAVVKEVVARFSRSVRSSLPLHDYMYLRLAEGMIGIGRKCRSGCRDTLRTSSGEVWRHRLDYLDGMLI